MTDEIACARCRARHTVVNRYSDNEDPCFTKLCLYVDEIKSLLGPRLENRIRWVLQEFVCNSKSRYARQFPRVKKFLNVVAAWTDCFDASGKDTDVRREMIKHAIEYLVKDGLVAQFADPAHFNTGPNKVDPDSLAAERNAFQSMNVWRFINEKDYWMCEDCPIDPAEEPDIDSQIPRCNKENCNSDLDVEIGSMSREPSTLYYTCRTTSACCSLCDQNVVNLNPSQTDPDRRNCHIIIKENQNTLNSSHENINTCNNINSSQTKDILHKFDIETECNCKSKIENSKTLHTQTSRPFYYFAFNLNQNILNPCKGIPRDVHISKPCKTMEDVKLSDKGTTCNTIRSTLPGNSKLKLYVHKATGISDSKIRHPAIISNLSLPCKSSQLIVRLFEADPSLSDSCLILMRKRFEKDIRNACSCMNDSLRKLEASVIKQLSLNCLIRPGRVDLNVRRRNGGCFDQRRFLARVPTCSNVHKRDSWQRNADIPKEPKAERSMDLPVDSPHRGNVMKCGKEFEESICPNLGSAVSKQVYPVGQEIEGQENDGRVTLVWTRAIKKKVDFHLSIGSTRSTKNEDFEVSIKEDTDVKSGQIRDGEKSELLDKERRDDKDDNVKECQKCRDGLHANENDFDNKIVDPCYLDCSCPTDSLKADTFMKGTSTGGCNPEQCFCHVLDADCMIEQDQRTCVCDSSLEMIKPDEENGNVDCSCDSQENMLKMKEFTLPKKMCVVHKKYSSFEGIASGLKAERIVSMKLERTDELKSKDFTMESTTRMEGNISDRIVKKGNALVAKERYSADSICSQNSILTVNSRRSKCSGCDKDHSNYSFENETNMADNGTIKDTEYRDRDTNLNTNDTPDLISTKPLITSETVKTAATFQFSKLKVSTKIIDESNIVSAILDNDSDKVSQKYPRANIQENSHEDQNDRGNILIDKQSKASRHLPEKCPSVPESLFVFYRETSLKDSSSTSNSTTDDESISYDYLSTRRQRARTKFQLPCDRSIPKTFYQKSNQFARCNPSSTTRNLYRVNSMKYRTLRMVAEEDGDRVGSRYKNRSWRGSIVPGTLCSSFPAIDRIKYLIRKKLRKLLLEERDKGTSTSKTYLRNDRYLVSVSSGKLNRGRMIRDSCSTRCPFTARNRYVAEGCPETTFTEGSILRKKGDILAYGIKDRCQRMIQGNDELKKIKVAKVSATIRQKCSTKSTDTKDLMNEKREIFVKSKFKAKKENRWPVNPSIDGRNKDKISSRLSLNSAGMIVIEDGDEFLTKNHNTKGDKINRNFPLDPNLSNICSGNDNCNCSPYECSPDNKRKVRGSFVKDKTYREKYRPFEKRLFKIEENRVEDYDFVSFFNDYEKRINDLDADFRLKLLQYVALCRSVKNSLIKRLQTDDVYEVSSGSAWGRKSFRD